MLICKHLSKHILEKTANFLCLEQNLAPICPKAKKKREEARVDTLPPLAPATPGGRATLISLCNYHTIKLSYCLTVILSNCLTIKKWNCLGVEKFDSLQVGELDSLIVGMRVALPPGVAGAQGGKVPNLCLLEQHL